jgi:hypothetical protein
VLMVCEIWTPCWHMFPNSLNPPRPAPMNASQLLRRLLPRPFINSRHEKARQSAAAREARPQRKVILSLIPAEPSYHWPRPVSRSLLILTFLVRGLAIVGHLQLGEWASKISDRLSGSSPDLDLNVAWTGKFCNFGYYLTDRFTALKSQRPHELFANNWQPRGSLFPMMRLQSAAQLAVHEPPPAAHWPIQH